jgi:hypothetical protein
MKRKLGQPWSSRIGAGLAGQSEGWDVWGAGVAVNGGCGTSLFGCQGRKRPGDKEKGGLQFYRALTEAD